MDVLIGAYVYHYVRRCEQFAVSCLPEVHCAMNFTHADRSRASIKGSGLWMEKVMMPGTWTSDNVCLLRRGDRGVLWLR